MLSVSLWSETLRKIELYLAQLVEYRSKCVALRCFSTGVQEKMGIMNRGVVYALWDYDVESPDELSFKEGDCLTVLRREDSEETEWWWARCADNEGYIPRNLLGVRKCLYFFAFPCTWVNDLMLI